MDSIYDDIFDRFSKASPWSEQQESVRPFFGIRSDSLSNWQLQRHCLNPSHISHPILAREFGLWWSRHSTSGSMYQRRNSRSSQMWSASFIAPVYCKSQIPELRVCFWEYYRIDDIEDESLLRRGQPGTFLSFTGLVSCTLICLQFQKSEGHELILI